jgi:hypothetical protein
MFATACYRYLLRLRFHLQFTFCYFQKYRKLSSNESQVQVLMIVLTVLAIVLAIPSAISGSLEIWDRRKFSKSKALLSREEFGRQVSRRSRSIKFFRWRLLPVSVSAALSALLLTVASPTVAALPLVLTFGFLLIFVIGRRPHFARDFVFQFVNGRSVSKLPPAEQPRHPTLPRSRRGIHV